MARKLKTHQTSLGFFEQAIAAPSMKAALEAWGADSNLFHQGAAKESADPEIIAATMKKVLKRPVGSDGPFGEHAELPTDLGDSGGRPAKAGCKPQYRTPKKISSGQPTRRRSGRLLSPTNTSRSSAMASGRGKRPPGRRSVNVGSRPSTRRKRRWTRLGAPMLSKPRPSKLSWRLLRSDHRPKMIAGIRRKSDRTRKAAP
jgi:hypothetical protein